MNELKVLIWLVAWIFRLTYRLSRAVLLLCFGFFRWARRRLRGEAVVVAPPPLKLVPAAARPPEPAERAAIDRLAGQLGALAKRARALEARCADEPLCAPLLPTLRDFVRDIVDLQQR